MKKTPEMARKMAKNTAESPSTTARGLQPLLGSGRAAERFGPSLDLKQRGPGRVANPASWLFPFSSMNRHITPSSLSSPMRRSLKVSR